MRAFKDFVIRPAPVLVLLAILSCGGRDPDSRPSPTSSAMLQVENRGFADMVVYAISGAQRIRLGIATGNSTRAFTIPNILLRGAAPLRFLADPIGGSRSPVSEEMAVQPGDIVTLTIPP
ncbi:MAG TPA: hypothetical protein VHH32_04075 [Gemmatimonadales bacterium]|nr:hypothetical protein [Gemmatimonadales bacterium]